LIGLCNYHEGDELHETDGHSKPACDGFPNSAQSHPQAEITKKLGFSRSVKATLADLRRVSGASVANQAVFLDGVSPEDAVPLHSGMVVTIVPRPNYATNDAPWRATIPAFADAALSQGRSDALKARRKEANPDEESQDG
jgi:hypothetical protein